VVVPFPSKFSRRDSKFVSIRSILNVGVDCHTRSHQAQAVLILSALRRIKPFHTSERRDYLNPACLLAPDGSTFGPSPRLGLFNRRELISSRDMYTVLHSLPNILSKRVQSAPLDTGDNRPFGGALSPPPYFSARPLPQRGLLFGSSMRKWLTSSCSLSVSFTHFLRSSCGDSWRQREHNSVVSSREPSDSLVPFNPGIVAFCGHLD